MCSGAQVYSMLRTMLDFFVVADLVRGLKSQSHNQRSNRAHAVCMCSRHGA